MNLKAQLQARANGADPKIEMTPAEARMILASLELAENTKFEDIGGRWEVYVAYDEDVKAFREAREKLDAKPAFDQRAAKKRKGE